MIKKIITLLIASLLIACTQSETPKSPEKNSNQTNSQAIVFDVRSAEEFQAGHLKNAINVPHTEISEKISTHVKSKDANIVLYCGSGRRAGIAKTALEEIGYTNITNAGGYEDLKKQSQD